MSTINNIHKYKKAKVIVKDLTTLQLIFDKFHKDIIQYVKYAPVQSMVRILPENIMLINAHLEFQQKILDSKGSEEL